MSTKLIEWHPPYCANDAGLDCPSCSAESSVRVREKETYFDGDCCDAYCAECHADLEVQVALEIVFSCPEVV